VETLSSLLGDHGAEVVTAAVAKRHAFLPGAAPMVESVFSWPRFNDVLRSAELDWVHPHVEGGAPRDLMALARRGSPVDPVGLFRQVLSPRRQPTYRLDPERLYQELRGGGTILVRELDRHVPDVAAVTQDLERLFDAPVMPGAFASWGDEAGFDLHWDTTDNLVVQVSGSRRWTLWRPTFPSPVGGSEAPRPEGPGVWSATLEAGDVLYFPRGWWHCPEGLGAPALHLTFGIYRRTGLDLFRWFCDQYAPGLTDPSVLRQRLDEEWNDAVVSQFLARQWETTVPNRATFDLPSAGVARPHARARIR
jgi:hypothetical protein